MTTILIKKKDTAGAPAAGDLTNAAGGAEIAVNTATKRIYTKDSGGNVVETGTNPSILNVDNIQIDVNTISSTDTNGNINLTPNGTGSVVISKLNVTGAITFDGNVTVGNSSTDTLTVNSTITSNLIFTDNTYDIGASGATRPRNLYTSGTGIFGGTLFTQSLAIGNARIQIRDNSIEEYAANSDSSVAVNYNGYQAGTTQFRDFDIYNGKNGFIATFEGATSRFGLGNANPSYVFDMIGQGRVVATGGASSATIPANNLFVVDSNANTGFGIAIPSTGNIVGGYYINAGTNQYDGGIDYQGTTRTLNLRSAGSSRVIIDSVGNTGLGITPTSSWSSGGQLQLADNKAIVSSGAYLNVGTNWYYDGGFRYISSTTATNYEQNLGSHRWLTAASGTAGSLFSFTQSMTLDANGVAYIGGTSGIGARLNLIKDTNSTVENLLWLRNSGTGYKGARITFGEYSSINGYITNQYISSGPTWCTDIGSTNVIRFFTGSDPGTQRGIFDSAGNFLVGTGTAPTSSGGTIGASNCLYVGSMSQNINYGNGISFGDVAKGLLLQQSVNTDDERVYLTNNAQTRTTSGFTGDFAYNKTGASASAYYSSVGYHRLLSAATGTAGGTITWTQVLIVGKDTTVALQGANAFTGTGITFPGTQSQSSNANTLDDYEEGSWTPSLNFGGGSTGITYTYRTGTYVKIGRQVTVWVTIYLSSKGSSTGDCGIAGLPYQPDQTFYNEEYGTAGEINNLTFSGYLAARVGGSASINVYQFTSGGSQTILSNGNFSNSTSIACTVTYTTNA